MSFEPLSPKRTWTGSTAPVRASLVIMRGGKTASLWIVLATRVLKEIGAETATHLAADIGTGADEGYVRLRLPTEGEEGFKLAKLPAGHSKRVSLGHIESLPNAKRNAVDAAHEIRDGALIVTLPPSFARPASPPNGGGTGRNPAPPAKAPTGPAPVAAVKKLSIDDATFSNLTVKAGLAFGCNRVEVLNPKDDHHWDAHNAIAKWMFDAGYAETVVCRKLRIADQADLIDALSAPIPPKKFARFRELVREALKLAGSPA